MPDALDAVSPLDGRYANQTASLVPFVSESALMRARVRVEVEYLIALSALDAVPVTFDEDERVDLRRIYRDFDREDAALIKRIETIGHDDQPATNHDVKAVEYFVRDRLPPRVEAASWVHFALTSEDVNNLAHRLLLKPAIHEVLFPRLDEIQRELARMARTHRGLVMLAHTHGQPATPTTFGKEVAVYALRLQRSLERIDDATDRLAGKLAGASGTYAAHVIAYPDVDWRSFARSFVTELGLDHVPLTTQVNPCDDMAALFSAIRRANTILVDLDRDMWLYISNGYLGQEPVAHETGSSTMPHKVNPIDFENSEGNLSKASADLHFLADYVTTSRLQRDLSDSTVKRNIGTALGHCLIGYAKLQGGLSKVVPNERVIRDDLEAHPEVIGEAIQTILRREGVEDAYERIKELTRGETVTLETIREAITAIDVDDAVVEEVLTITPETYFGLARDLVDEVEDR